MNCSHLWVPESSGICIRCGMDLWMPPTRVLAHQPVQRWVAPKPRPFVTAMVWMLKAATVAVLALIVLAYWDKPRRNHW